jgi:hypothetical protein
VWPAPSAGLACERRHGVGPGNRLLRATEASPDCSARESGRSPERGLHEYHDLHKPQVGNNVRLIPWMWLAGARGLHPSIVNGNPPLERADGSDRLPGGSPPRA